MHAPAFLRTTLFLALSCFSLSDGRLSLAAQESESTQIVYDWVFVGGHVMDGSGNPWFKADVAVKDGRIAFIGKLGDQRSRRKVSAQGKLIVPGFIDLHSHADEPLRGLRGLRSGDPQRRSAPNLIGQGATTVVVNQDGRSPWPISDQRKRMEELGIGPNAILLVGHGSIRRLALGDDFRRPSNDQEIEKMRGMVRQAMAEGALGISAGLEYVPGRWSETRELVALCQEIATYQGVYVSHQRSEGANPLWFFPSRDQAGPPTLLDAVRETIEIGRLSGAVVVASHIKAKGAGYWGSGQAAIRMIESARAKGIEVWADQYPYDTTGSDGGTVLIPAWAVSNLFENEGRSDDGKARSRGYAAALRITLKDAGKSAKLRQDIAHEISRRGGSDRIVVFDYPLADAVGKSLAELAAQRGIDPVEMAIALQLEGYSNRRGGARLRGFSLHEDDIIRYASTAWTATASDAGITLPQDGPVHARFYGTFPRKIRRYALDLEAISLEHAIRSMTSLPAQILRLSDRGLLRVGFAADLVVLDLEKLSDRATFFKPHQHSQGIDFVLVNGEGAVDNGRLTGSLAGKVITSKNR